MKKELINKKGHIKYILQLILEFEIENINNNNKNDNNIIFNYFEEFSFFEKEIKDIIKISKKSQNFFDLYILQKDMKNNIKDEKLKEKIILDMKKDAELNGENNNKMKIDYLLKILYMDKSLELIKKSYSLENEKNEDEEIIGNNNNNRMIIE